MYNACNWNIDPLLNNYMQMQYIYGELPWCTFTQIDLYFINFPTMISNNPTPLFGPTLLFISNNVPPYTCIIWLSRVLTSSATIGIPSSDLN